MVFTKGNSLLNTFSGQFTFISKEVGVVKSSVFLEMIYFLLFSFQIALSIKIGWNFKLSIAYKLGKSFKIKRSFNGVILLSG
jgi:hypothetical protein